MASVREPIQHSEGLRVLWVNFMKVLSSRFMAKLLLQTVQLRATRISWTSTMLLVLLASCLESFQPCIQFRSLKLILTPVNPSVDLTGLVNCVNPTNPEYSSVSNHLDFSQFGLSCFFYLSGKIIPNNPSRAFLGYVDKNASDKKIVRDVFHKGDSAFLSGDILTADERGNLFFVDRTGDTFRVSFILNLLKLRNLILVFISGKARTAAQLRSKQRSVMRQIIVTASFMESKLLTWKVSQQFLWLQLMTCLSTSWGSNWGSTSWCLSFNKITEE